MAAGDFVVKGTATVPVSGPGEIATVTVTATGAAAGDVVVITPTNTVNDANGPFVFKVTNVTTNAFTITADRAQLPTAATFTFIVFDAA
jgi:hypothetical protein